MVQQEDMVVHEMWISLKNSIKWTFRAGINTDLIHPCAYDSWFDNNEAYLKCLVVLRVQFYY